MVNRWWNGATKELAYKVGPRSDKKVLIRITTGGLAWGAAVVAGKTDVPLKKWTHIAGTYDAKSGEGKIYIDGALDGEGKLGGEIRITMSCGSDAAPDLFCTDTWTKCGFPTLHALNKRFGNS